MKPGPAGPLRGRASVPEFISEKPSSLTALPTWSSLQPFSTARWCSTLLKRVLNSRTSFSKFVKTTLHADRSCRLAPDRALFPLPIPKCGLFEDVRVGSRQRRKRAFGQAFHIVVMALNFWHADFKFIPVDALTVHPSSKQREVLLRVRNLCKAFGNSLEEISIPESGRRSSTLVALLADLSDFVTWEGLSGDAYFRGFPGDVDDPCEPAVVPVDRSRAEQLEPYRPLDPSCLKITGSASWNPQEYLSDALWLAYVEPVVLIWTEDLPVDDFPDLSKEKYQAVLDLVKLWDAKGLVSFREASPQDSWRTSADIRFFNCYMLFWLWLC